MPKFGGLPVAPILKPDMNIPSHFAAWDAESKLRVLTRVPIPENVVMTDAICAPLLRRRHEWDIQF
jgi:hypothetical protein